MPATFRRRSLVGLAAATAASSGVEAGSSTPHEVRDRLAAHLKEWRARMLAVGITPAN
jgi:hypothetical protein